MILLTLSSAAPAPPQKKKKKRERETQQLNIYLYDNIFCASGKKTLDTHTAVPCSLAAHKRLKEYEWPSGFWKISNQENVKRKIQGKDDDL